MIIPDGEVVLSTDSDDDVLTEDVISTGEDEGVISTGEDEGVISTGEDEDVISTGEDEGVISTGENEDVISIGENDVISTAEDEGVISTAEDEGILSTDEDVIPTGNISTERDVVSIREDVEVGTIKWEKHYIIIIINSHNLQKLTYQPPQISVDNYFPQHLSRCCYCQSYSFEVHYTLDSTQEYLYCSLLRYHQSSLPYSKEK